MTDAVIRPTKTRELHNHHFDSTIWNDFQVRDDDIIIPASDTRELERLSNLPTELALQRGAPFLAHLARDPAFQDALVFPLLKEARRAEEWYVAHRYDAQDGSYSLQVFVWPPGTRTHIHDHTSWGAYCCAVGSVLEERYERLDDGAQLNYARPTTLA
jgi:hypothetical protein